MHSDTGRLDVAESREWLCTNGLGGFASGTVAGLLTRRYHGLLVAALKPPVGRTVMATGLEEEVEYDGRSYALATDRWADGTIAPAGHRLIERFHLDGTTPVWQYACAEALVEKRVWMEPGANTTYVRYRLLSPPAGGPVRIRLRALVNYRDYHATTRGRGWRMQVDRIEHGLRITAFAGARPLLILVPGAGVERAHDWYVGFRLAAEEARGLDALDDNLHAGTFAAPLEPGRALTCVLSAEASPALGDDEAWHRRRGHEAEVLLAWRKAEPAARAAPAWIDQLVLAADQFLVSRPLADDPGGLSLIAGYHWFGDWGRDTMISLPGLTLATGRPEAARRILKTFARYVDGGMLPNVFPDDGERPPYNTVDAALWYVEAARAYHAATGHDATVVELFPALEQIIHRYAAGTRHGIRVDPADGLLIAGEPGVPLTWMDAKVGGWVVTPRIGKPVEINALWYNGLIAMAGLARRLGRESVEWQAMAERAAPASRGFGIPPPAIATTSSTAPPATRRRSDLAAPAEEVSREDGGCLRTSGGHISCSTG